MNIERVANISGLSACEVSNIYVFRWLIPEPSGEASYIFLHDGRVLELCSSTPPEWVRSDVLAISRGEEPNRAPSTYSVKSSVDAPHYETNAKSALELVIRLAHTGFEGKKRPEFLERMLRAPKCRSEFTTENWDMLADYVGGKLNKKTGRPRKGEEAFYMVGHPLTSERVAAHRVLANMDARRKNREPVRNIQRQLIDVISEEEGADPGAVTELLRTRRGL